MMSDNKSVEGQKVTTDKAELPTPVETKAPSLEELQAEIDSLKASKDRVLKESKDHASKYREMRDSIEAKEKEELSKKEDWKKLLEKEIEKRQSAEKKLGGLKTKVINKTLDLELARLASDAQSIDSLKKLLPIDLLNVEEEDEEIKISGVEDAIKKMRLEQPYLFKNNKNATMVTTKPGTAKTETLTLDKITNTRDLAKLLVEARNKQI